MEPLIIAAAIVCAIAYLVNRMLRKPSKHSTSCGGCACGKKISDQRNVNGKRL